MSPIAASSSRNIVASGATGQAQGSKSPASASDQGFNALLQSGMVQPPQPIQAPPDPPKAVVNQPANHQSESSVNAATAANSQASAAETSNQPPTQTSNETGTTQPQGSKGSEIGPHLATVLQSLASQGPGASSSKALASLDSNSTTKTNDQFIFQSSTSAAAKVSNGTQGQSAPGAASALAALQDPKVISTQPASAGPNSNEALSSTSASTPTSGSKKVAEMAAANPPVQAGSTEANTTLTSGGEPTAPLVLDPAVKLSTSGSSSLSSKAPINLSINTDPGFQSTSASSSAQVVPTAAAKSEMLAATGEKFLLPSDLRAATTSSELSKSSSGTGNADAVSLLATASHPAQQFEVISLTGSAPGLDSVATNLANFVIKETNPISEMPKVTIMTLEPRDLGTIVVKMTMDGSGLQMELGVSNPHVSAMLNASLGQLKESISTASGMSVHIGFSTNPNLSGQGRQGTQTPKGAALQGRYIGDPRPATQSPWPAQQPLSSSSSHRLDRRI